MKLLALILLIPILCGFNFTSPAEYKNLSTDQKYEDLKLRFLLDEFTGFGDSWGEKRKNIEDQVTPLLTRVSGNKKKFLELALIQFLIDDGKLSLAEKNLDHFLGESSPLIKGVYFRLKALIAYRNNDKSSSITFLEKGLDYATGIERYRLLYYISWLEMEMGNVDKAIDYVKEGLEIVKGYKYGQATLSIAVGRAYQDKGDIALSLDSYFKALEVLKELGDNHRIVLVLNNIALVKKGLKEYDDELSYYLKAEKYFSSAVAAELNLLKPT